MMLRDNASNGKKACNDWNIKHFGCIAHSIHLIVGPFLIEKSGTGAMDGANGDAGYQEEDDDEVNFDDPTSTNVAEEVVAVRKIITKVWTIVKYIKYSRKAKEKLSSYCSNNETLGIVLDVQTRWNSALDMIQKFLKLKNPVEQFLAFLVTSQGRWEFSSKSLPSIMEAD